MIRGTISFGWWWVVVMVAKNILNVASYYFSPSKIGQVLLEIVPIRSILVDSIM